MLEILYAIVLMGIQELIAVNIHILCRSITYQFFLDDLIYSSTATPSVTPSVSSTSPAPLSESILIIVAVLTAIVGAIVFFVVVVFCIQWVRREIKRNKHPEPRKKTPPLQFYDDPEPEAYEMQWQP